MKASPPGLGRCELHVFFFQAEDGIRDYKVTGVQTCALPICRWEADELREFVDECGERADFAFNKVRGLFDKAGQFGIERLGGFGFGAALEMADKALGRKLNRSERILDFVGDAASDFLPGGGFLREKEFGEVV